MSLDVATNQGEPTGIDYNSMTVEQLKALCKEKGLTGYSGQSKSELVKILEGA